MQGGVTPYKGATPLVCDRPLHLVKKNNSL